MHKINNKNIDHIIKTVALTLCSKWNIEYEKQTITGKDLMLSGLPKLGFNASQVVEFDVPIFTLVNHESEMKRIYKEKGLKELDKYVSQYRIN